MRRRAAPEHVVALVTYDIYVGIAVLVCREEIENQVADDVDGVFVCLVIGIILVTVVPPPA